MSDCPQGIRHCDGLFEVNLAQAETEEVRAVLKRVAVASGLPRWAPDEDIRARVRRLTAVAEAARALHGDYDPDDGFCCSKDVHARMSALGAALDALDGER